MVDGVLWGMCGRDSWKRHEKGKEPLMSPELVPKIPKWHPLAVSWSSTLGLRLETSYMFLPALAESRSGYTLCLFHERARRGNHLGTSSLCLHTSMSSVLTVSCSSSSYWATRRCLPGKLGLPQQAGQGGYLSPLLLQDCQFTRGTEP